MKKSLIYGALLGCTLSVAAQQETTMVQVEYALVPFTHNSVLSDFAPTYYGDDIVFSSNRFGNDSKKIAYEGQEQPFFDLLLINEKDNNASQFSKRINSKYHESTAVFTKDKRTVYFTRNNFTNNKLRADATLVNRLQLYRATLDNNEKWQVEPLPFNNDDYSTAHPALSADENILYFASDMPGTLGKSDIFMVEILGTHFGQITPLPASLNSEARETFPFVDHNGTLYFSSDREGGMGQLDIYKSIQKEDLYIVDPLPAPINSIADDITFIINPSGNGYFASNREDGLGGDDIYAFAKAETPKPIVPTICERRFVGNLFNTYNQKRIGLASIQLKNNEGNILQELESSNDGLFSFSTPLTCNQEYILAINKLGFKPFERTFNSSQPQEELDNLSLDIEPIIEGIYEEKGIKKFRIEHLTFDLGKDNIRPDAARELDKVVSIMTEYPSIIIKIEAHTDARGSSSSNRNLSDRRAKSTQRYLISKGINVSRVESAIGYGEDRLLNSCADGVTCSKEQHDINRRSDFIITKM